MNRPTRIFRAAPAAILLGGAAVAVSLAQVGGGFDLTWNTLDAGGATFSTGGVYRLGGTMGQSDAAAGLSGGGYTIRPGFWFGAPRPCPADLDGTGTVDGADLGLLLQQWDPLGPTTDPADLNGDGRVDGADLGLLLQGWGPCPVP